MACQFKSNYSWYYPCRVYAMNVRKEIANNLIANRKKCGMTQGQLAKLISVQRTTISAWETCAAGIDADSLYKLAKVLGISIRDLYGDYALAEITEVSKQEQEILETFRMLSNRDKNIVLSLLNAMKT